MIKLKFKSDFFGSYNKFISKKMFCCNFFNKFYQLKTLLVKHYKENKGRLQKKPHERYQKKKKKVKRWKRKNQQYSHRHYKNPSEDEK